MADLALEPAIKRAAVFIDGQNLFYAAKEAFGSLYPDYDAKALADRVCKANGLDPISIRFYTGVPDAQDNVKWSSFWAKKLLGMSRDGVMVYSRPLKYRNKTVKLPDGKTHSFLSASEKGVDIRIALDVIRMAIKNEYDVALIFSQDQDFSEVADEVRLIGAEHKRWVQVASAYPASPTFRNGRGINRTNWIKIDRATYQACLDAYNYGI